MGEKPWTIIVRNRLIAGIITVLPAVLTIWVVVSLVRLADAVFQPIFQLIFQRTFPGFGIILAPIILYLVGMIVQNRISNRMVRWGETVLQRAPVVGSIYSAVKQTVDAFDFSQAEEKFNRVVFVEYPKQDSWSLGFVTREILFLNEKSLCLFIPTTPNPTSGVLIIVPEKETVATNMTMEEAAKFVVSAGLVVPALELTRPTAQNGQPAADAVMAAGEPYE
jgi:uncharacterized membrane protein